MRGKGRELLFGGKNKKERVDVGKKVPILGKGVRRKPERKLLADEREEGRTRGSASGGGTQRGAYPTDTGLLRKRLSEKRTSRHVECQEGGEASRKEVTSRCSGGETDDPARSPEACKSGFPT